MVGHSDDNKKVIFAGFFFPTLEDLHVVDGNLL